MEKSKNYDKVARFYGDGFWSVGMVRNAVGRWITPEEYKLITGKVY